MTIDILFLAKNRLAYTREALSALLANTNWGLVRNLVIHDDGSTDGTHEMLMETVMSFDKAVELGAAPCGSPAAVMNFYMSRHPLPLADALGKVDSDTIVPPGWLDQCAAVMEAHPELDLLGIEPPESRVPHFAGGKRNPQPEVTGSVVWGQASHIGDWRNAKGEMCSHWTKYGYAPCTSIGGIGLMRTRWFTERPPLRPHSIHGGFTEAQESDKKGVKGWIVPPLKCFLLDRLPMEPWVSLGREYERQGFQRAWQHYPESAKDALWSWWRPAE